MVLEINKLIIMVFVIFYGHITSIWHCAKGVIMVIISNKSTKVIPLYIIIGKEIKLSLIKEGGSWIGNTPNKRLCKRIVQKINHQFWNISTKFWEEFCLFQSSRPIEIKDRANCYHLLSILPPPDLTACHKLENKHTSLWVMGSQILVWHTVYCRECFLSEKDKCHFPVAMFPMKTCNFELFSF